MHDNVDVTFVECSFDDNTAVKVAGSETGYLHPTKPNNVLYASINTGKTNKVLRFLSSSGEKQNVEQLKAIRKQHGAQSKEYKEALTTLEK